MKKLEVKKSIEINADAKKAWELLGPQFLNVSNFIRGIEKSYDNPNAPKNFADAPAGGRYCEVKGFGKVEEEILHYDDTKNEISWSAVGEKIPGFVQNLQNQLKVESVGENKSRVTSSLSADLKGLGGFFMGGMIHKNFDKTLNGFFKDLKTYSETGKISAAKERELSAVK